MSPVFLLSLFFVAFAMLAQTVLPTTVSPSFTPTKSPTRKPTTTPTNSPTFKPSTPTNSPTVSPSTGKPTKKPWFDPTGQPSMQPTGRPTSHPTTSMEPTPVPSGVPTSQPTRQPSSTPTGQPTGKPTRQPTGRPTSQPSSPTGQPSSTPSGQPTGKPSRLPTGQLTGSPTSPSFSPTKVPSKIPTAGPTVPTDPTRTPTTKPTPTPTRTPTTKPTRTPTMTPTRTPTIIPTRRPTIPTGQPTRQPTGQPTASPSRQPSSQPTNSPSRQPSSQPTSGPTGQPTSQPSVPTGQPTGRPTAFPTFTKRPSGQPTGQPSRLPSGQPTSSPSKKPTFAPSNAPLSPSMSPTLPIPTRAPTPTLSPTKTPTRVPSRQPTYKYYPTFKPTVDPTFKPTEAAVLTEEPTTSQPTSSPTSTPTAIPTYTYPWYVWQYNAGSPSGQPTSQPSSAPTTWWSTTSSPTYLYEYLNVTGSINYMYPGVTKLSPCDPVHVIIYLTFNRRLEYGSEIKVETPGLTSGLCTSASNGGDISSLNLFNDTIWAASYYEGDYGDQYKHSFIVLRLLLEEAAVNFKYKIDIDRNNTLKKVCVNTTESLVTVGISNNTVLENLDYYDNTTLTYGIGTITIDDGNRDTECFIYDSSLTFFPPHQQLDLGINVTLALPFAFGLGDYIKIKLPGISNGNNNYPLNPRLWSDSDGRMYDHGYSVTHAGSDVTDITVSFSTKYNWTADWHEGNTSDAFAGSYVTLYPGNSSHMGDYFWISLERFGNNFAAVCGTQKNNSKYTIEVVANAYLDNAFSVAETAFSYVSGIGSQCKEFNYCNGNGYCDYCGSKCVCYDGFGSSKDRKYAVSNDFLPDCSSKTCPIGASVGSRPQFMKQGYHRDMECSNNGLCDRASGLCKCREGFEGSACERMKCGGTPICSRRGRCLPIYQLAYQTDAMPLITDSYKYSYKKAYNINGTYWNSNTQQFEGTNGNDTLGWDYKFSHTCLCDSGWTVGLEAKQTQASEYFGPSCEYRRCPSGDDPITTFADETNCTGRAMTDGGEVGLLDNLCHVDCSNRGTCNYNTGVCKCYPGFTGANCNMQYSGTVLLN